MRYTLLLLVISIIFQSCEYEPEGFYDANLTEPQVEDQNVTVNLDNASSSLNIGIETNFTYNVNVGELSLYEVQISLDDEIIHTNNYKSGNFFIDPKEYSRGTYTLKLESITSTGSSSLGDVTGNEVFVIVNQWELNLDGEAPNPINIISSRELNGSLEISWEEYTRINFQKYELYKRITKEGGGYIDILIDVIDDASITTCLDESYIGENVDYYIKTYASDLRTDGDLMNINYGLPKIIVEEKVHFSTTLTWTKSKFYSNFNSYDISIDNINGVYELYSTEDINDTTCTISEIVFGDQYDILLGTNPVLDPDHYDHGSEIRKSNYRGFIGERIPFNDCEIIATKNTEYLFPYKLVDGNNNLKIFRYSTVNNELEDSILILDANIDLFDLSMNSEYLICGSSNKLVKINPFDFSDYVEHSSEEISGDINSRFEEVSIANNGVAAISTSVSTIIYDFSTNLEVYRDNEVRSYLLISPNANYVIYRTRREALVFYKLNGNSLDSLGAKGAGRSKEIQFNPMNYNELVYYRDSHTPEFIFIDCQTISVNHSFYIGSNHIYNIDPITGYIILFSGSFNNGYPLYDLYDTSTGDKVSSVWCISSNSSIINSTLYSKKGYRINLALK